MKKNGWSSLHDIALIYLTCMHGADDEIDPSEYSLVKDLIERRIDDESVDASQVLEDVMLMYVSQSSYDMVSNSIASISDESGRDLQISILRDLADIVAADGVVSPGEVHFITAVAREWGLEDYLSAGGSTAS